MALVKELLERNISPHEIKKRFEQHGFLESDIDDAIEKCASELKIEKYSNIRSLRKHFSWKEALDRIGYGFVSHPFLNILFSFAGASIFLIGLINGLRTVISLLYSSFLKEFSKVHEISKAFISNAGILYGLSFLFMSFAVVLRSPLIFAISFLVGSIGVVAHGEVYSWFLKSTLKKEKMGFFLSRISTYGLFITIFCMLISGYIMDLFPFAGQAVSFNFLGTDYSWKIYGYLISFEITAFAFIFSGFVLSRVKQKKIDLKIPMITFVEEFHRKFKVHSKFFLNNKAVLLLTLTSIITGVVQVLGNSFYGIFIFNEFKNQFLGGFMNVAVIFSLAVVFAFIGPWFTKTLRHHIGISPMLVFGTLLTAMLPLSLAFNPNIYVIAVATSLSVIGSSILGMAQGFFTRKLLGEQERQIYFSFLGVAVSLPLLIAVPVGAYLGDMYGLVTLFKALIILLVFVATPLYFAIVLMYEKSNAAASLKSE